MAEPTAAEGKEGAPAFHPEARARFRAALAAAGFARTEDRGRDEWWAGTVTARWSDPVTGELRAAEHKVQLVLPPGFPFRAPSVYAADRPATIPPSRHVVQLPDGALCLYAASYQTEGRRGWAPWRTGEEYLERLRELLARAHDGQWAPEDRPPDLHTGYPRLDGVSVMTFVGAGWAPPNDAPSGRFGLWQRPATATRPARACAAHPVAGAGTIPAAPGDDLALDLLGFGEAPRAGIGAWFRLSCEPEPRTTLGGVLAEIDRATGHERGWALAQCRRLIGGLGGGMRPAHLALGYPDAGMASGESWLFLEARPAGKGKPMRWTDPASLDRALVGASETVSVRRDALMRRVGPLARAVAGRTVAVFGAGALGGTVALLLARSGVERLILVDGDRVRPGNVVRHVADLGDAGRLKTHAVYHHVMLHAPEAVVEPHDATWDPDALRQLVTRADVVVDATAEVPFNLLINDVCVRAGRPLVQVETTRRAAVGRVRVVRPGRDACLLCYTALAAGAPASGYPVVPPGDQGEFFDEGCGVPTVEAPAVDVEATANWAARTALWVLRDVLGPRNHALVVNNEVPGLSGDLAVVGVHWSVFPPVPGCECCGAATAAVPGLAA